MAPANSRTLQGYLQSSLHCGITLQSAVAPLSARMMSISPLDEPLVTSGLTVLGAKTPDCHCPTPLRLCPDTVDHL